MKTGRSGIVFLVAQDSMINGIIYCSLRGCLNIQIKLWSQ